MARFLLALRDDPGGLADVSPAEIGRIIQRYVAWTKRQAEAGRLVFSDKLEDGTGQVMRASGGDVRVVDGPFAETKEILGGFYVLEAASYEAAVDVCRDCPHLDFGSIEIRRIEDVDKG